MNVWHQKFKNSISNIVHIIEPKKPDERNGKCIEIKVPSIKLYEFKISNLKNWTN